MEWLRLRLANPEDYENEFGDAGPDEWRPWGAYGILGWRHLLPFVLLPIIGLRGNKRLVEKYRANPIRFFRERTSLKARIIGRILYPFDARK